MTGTRVFVSAVFACAVAFMGCEKHSHPHGEGHAHGGDEHPHGSERGGARPAEPERPDLSITVYQSGLELFMEYPALVVGMESPLIAHFTDARSQAGFKPIESGRVVATLRFDDGAEERFVADKVLRTGIFKPVVKPSRAGKGRLRLALESQQVSGTVDVGVVVVHADLAAALAANPEEAPGGEEPVGFLKEQQWKTEYATAAAEPRVLQGGVRANGELKPVPGQAAELSSPVQGRIAVGETVPHVGQRVKKGELLLRVIPTAIAAQTDAAQVELEASRARAELGLARRELARAEELLAAKAIPEKQLDVAKTAVQVAEARVAAAEQQRSQFLGVQSGAGGARSFELRSPIDAVISYADVMPGAVVEPGRRLVSVVNPDRLWLHVRVFESDAPAVDQATGASFTVAGFEEEFSVDTTNGRRVAVGAVVDPLTRTVPVIFELPNPGGRLKPGMFAQATVFTGATVRGVAIPESAVIDDDGRPTVFVMEGGESFFKRAVKLGVRSGGFVQVLSGVREGERVVSLGAWEIKLAAASGGIPEHGHSH